jgi:serine/threonine protein kinase
MNLCGNCGLDNPAAASFCSNCGFPLQAAATAAPPGAGYTLPLSTLLHGQYLILKKLAEGGMGAVYLAQDQKLFGRFCVVKEMLHYYTTPAERAEAEAKFEREARLLATLNHPGIPQVYDYFVEQHRYYLVMQFVDGENLEERLLRVAGPLPEREVVDYATQVASVLAYISQQNPPVIHRDIKPANIILDRNTGQVKLVDYGIAREAAPRTGPVQSSPLGTIGYSPPEQYSGNTEPRSDVFALGATIHHLLTNQDPRQATRVFYYPPLRQLVPGLSPELEPLVGAMLEGDPHQRPTAVEVRNQLKALTQPRVPSAAGPLAMRSGIVVHDVQELAQECDRNWEDGIYHLFNGHLEPWLEAQNRRDLAGRAETIRKRGGDLNAGLEEFLRALNPTMPLPALRVTPSSLPLGVLERGDRPRLTLEVENIGRGYLTGDARTLVPWAQVTPAAFGCMHGEKVALTLELDTGQLAEGNVDERLLTLSSNGGQVTIDAQFLVTWRPRLALDVASLDLGEVLEEDLGQTLSGQFTVVNSGGGLLEGTIYCPAGWVLLGARDFRLASGQGMVVAIAADTGQLSQARMETAPIMFGSTAGTLVLPVRVGVSKRVFKQRRARWTVYGLLLLVAMLGWSIAAALSMWSLMDLQRKSTPAAIWLGSLLVAGWIAMRIARRQILLLDEIEIYYHRGDLVSEIPLGSFDGRRLALTTVALALAGLCLGLSYSRSHPASTWSIPVGLAAGAVLGALLPLGSGPWTLPGPVTRVGGVPLLGGNPERFGGVRMLVSSFAMAALATLAFPPGNRTLGLATATWWAMLGLVATAEAYPHLPLRLRWLLAKVRPGLLCVVLAYFGWLVGVILLFQQAIPLVSFYAYLPPLMTRTALRFLVVIALSLGGMLLGLWADNTWGKGRRAAAVAMLRALLPGSALAIAGFALGRILFGLFGGTAVRGWGTLAAVLAVEGATGWLLATRPVQVSQAGARLRAAAAGAVPPAVRQARWPTWAATAWGRISGRMGPTPAGGWLSGLTLPLAVGVAGVLALLTPLALYVLATFLKVLGIAALIVVPLAVLAWLLVRYLRTR